MAYSVSKQVSSSQASTHIKRKTRIAMTHPLTGRNILEANDIVEIPTTKEEKQTTLQITTQDKSDSDNLPAVTETDNASSSVPIADNEISNTILTAKEDMKILKTENSDKESCLNQSPVITSSENKENNKQNTKDIIPDENKEDKSYEQSQRITKYYYKDDQWSPLNPEGKKQYDRDFLIHLQTQPMCLSKPTEMPNLDIIKDKAHIHRLPEYDQMERDVIPSLPSKQSKKRGNISSRGCRGSRGHKMTPMTEDSKLHKAENSWKVDKKSDENKDEEEYFKKISPILNKLTSENFEKLLDQMKELSIDTVEKLKGVVNLILEKAIVEPNFSMLYAKMCRGLALMTIEFNDRGDEINFRDFLIMKFQKVFEQDTSNRKNSEDVLKAMNVVEDDEEKMKKMQLELDEEKKIRMRRFGTIEFIANLLKLQLPIKPVLHACIRKLLTQGDEESLECLCRILIISGKELYGNRITKEIATARMDSYFAAIQNIIDKRLTGPRVRLMLQDVVHLKKNNWISTRDTNNDDIINQKKEEDQEETKSHPVNENANDSKYLSDDWNKLSDFTLNAPEGDFENKTKLLIEELLRDEDFEEAKKSAVKLTSPHPAHYFIYYSIQQVLQKSSQDRSLLGQFLYFLLKKYIVPFEEFKKGVRGVLQNTDDYTWEYIGEILEPVIEDKLPVSFLKVLLRPCVPSEAAGTLVFAILHCAAKKMNNWISMKDKNNQNNPDQSNKDMKDESHKNQAADQNIQPSKQLSDEWRKLSVSTLSAFDTSEGDFETKTKLLVEEFLHNKDFEKAEKSAAELISPRTAHYFIYYSISQVLETSSQVRNLLGQFLYSLIQKYIVPLEEYKRGLSGVLQNTDDYAWEYIGEILEPIIEDKLPTAFLKALVEPCVPPEAVGTLIYYILHCAAKEMKHGFTVNPPIKINIEVTRKIGELLENKEDNESIFDYIDAKVPPHILIKPTAFIRGLTQEIMKAAITGADSKCKLDQEILKKRIHLLTRYIDHDENLELQALFAVQHLMTSLNHPKGVLRQIFDVLYDEDVVTEEIFKVWENSNDPAELEGKEDALNCVRGFFAWLREADESGEELENE